MGHVWMLAMPIWKTKHALSYKGNIFMWEHKSPRQQLFCLLNKMVKTNCAFRNSYFPNGERVLNLFGAQGMGWRSPMQQW